VLPDKPGRSERNWVLALLALALALRVGFVLFQQPGFYFEDSLDFDRAARALLDTGHFDERYYRFPFYPVFMAASYRLFGGGLMPIRLFQSLMGVATCACIWRVGRRLFGIRAGLLALMGAAIFPVHVVLAGIEYPVVPATLLVWAVLMVYGGTGADSRRKPSRLLLAGLGTGISMLVFEGGFVLGLFLLLWTLFDAGSRGMRLKVLSLVGAGTLIIFVPWILGMSRTGDYRPLVLRAGIHLPTPPGVNPPLWEGSGGNLLRAKVSGMVRHPLWVLDHGWGEFVHFWNPYPDRLASADAGFRANLHEKDRRMVVDNSLVGDLPRRLYALGFTLLLLAAGAGAMVALHRVPGAGFLAAWPVVLGACYAPFFTQMRYRIPADPAFILLGAYAVELTLQRTLWGGLRDSSRALWEGWKRIATKIAVVQTFILLFLLFVVAMGPIALLMKLFRKDPMHAPRAAGSFWALREKTREGMEECLRQF
jgi:4-amino-4-deoxy-L-arabinose transferase-like glycosyltransferase